MILEFKDCKYINTDQITHIVPDKYDSLKSHIYLSNGECINIKNDVLKDVLKKLKVGFV